MDYQDLTEDGKSSVKWMVEFCINRGYCMGMGEGLDDKGHPKPARQELEQFSGYKRGDTTTI